MAKKTNRFEFNYFGEGVEYDSELEARRFVSLDYNLESYVGIIGVGVIDGWGIEDQGGGAIKISPGSGIIDGFFAESPYKVKKRSGMISGEREIYTVNINDSLNANMTDEEADNYIDIIQEYDPLFNPSKPIEDAYVKVVVPEVIGLSGDTDYYIYVTRKYTNFYPNLSDYPPYLIDIPNQSDFENLDEYFEAYSLYEEQMDKIYSYNYTLSSDNHFTEVAFNYSTTFSVSANKILIGKVSVRNNLISNIDLNGIETIKNLQSTITRYAKDKIPKHIHGGSRSSDPDRINLETDIRDAKLISYNKESRVGTFGVLESQFTSKTDDHKHTLTIDSNGNGQTIGIIGNSPPHFHKIINGEIQPPEDSIEDVASHTHQIASISRFPWDSDSEYVVYLNDIPIGDKNSENISVDPQKRTISISGSLGVNNKTYQIDFEFLGERFIYELQENSAYRFMQKAISFFNQSYPDLSPFDSPFVFIDEETNTLSSFEDLKKQCLAADSLMEKEGDSILLTPDAAKNIKIKLIQYEKRDGIESNKIKIEILGNSEVTGVLREENIAFINASKISSGILSIERIPLISHVGRIREKVLPFDYYLISQNGIVFSVMPSLTDFNLDHFHDVFIDLDYNGQTDSTYVSEDPILYASGKSGNDYLIAHSHSINNGEINSSTSNGLIQWYNENNDSEQDSSAHTHNLIYPVVSDAKVIYSIYEDDLNNIYLGTSDSFIMVPSKESYLFVINGYKYYEIGDDLLSMFESAKYKYENQTGNVLDISSDIYQYQILIAEKTLIKEDDSYLIVGKSSPTSILDRTMIQKVSYIPVPNYRTESLKEIGEITDEDLVIEIQLRDSQSGSLLNSDSDFVKEQIEEDPESVKLIAKTERYLDFIPVKNIEIQKINNNNTIERNILNISGEYIATNKNINENFYFDWTSPNTPTSVSSFNNAKKDNEENVWVASDNGVYILRSYNKRNVLSPAARVGQSPFINDIFPIYSNNVICCSDGIYKTEDQGKTWSKKESGDFLKINVDYSSTYAMSNNGHNHEISVNLNGDGLLLTNDGHTHDIKRWVVEESNGHSHDLIFPIYSATREKIFKSIDNGENWEEILEFPKDEIGEFFVFNGTIYLSYYDGVYIYSGGWEKISNILAYSFQFSHDLGGFYIGSENILYYCNGVKISLYKEFPGNGSPSLRINYVDKKFNYFYSNKEQKFYLKYLQDQLTDIRAKVDFSKWIAEYGRWNEDDKYEIYIKDKLIISTKDDVDNKEERGYSFYVNPNQGVIDFSGFSNANQKINFYDSFIDVDDISDFEIGDRILIKSLKSLDLSDIKVTDENSAEAKANQTRNNEKIKRSYFYATITNKSDDFISFWPRSDIDIDLPIGVYKIPNLNSNSDILMNIYNSIIYNIGKYSHKEIEDKLSYESDNRPYFLNNIYISNLLQLTQAVRYVYPSINSEMKNSLFYDFHYSKDPSEENYYKNYIDTTNSDLYSLINFSSDYSPYGSSIVNKILIGSGLFSGKVFIGTDIGLFWSEFNESLGSNWFYIFDISSPVYDIKVFGEEFLFIATSSGLYMTNDMKNFALQNEEQINFPCYSLSLRWPQSDFFTIPYHDAIFENLKDEFGNNFGGQIRSIGPSYSSLLEGKAIRIKTSDIDNPINNSSYIIDKVFDKKIILTSSFDIDYQIINIEIKTGSWWQNFSGENNLNNISITNTLLVGGDSKISYSPYVDSFIWNSSVLDSSVKNYNVNKFLPISNGLILAIANTKLLNNVTNYILKSSDIGQNWSIKNKFEAIRGRVISSRITRFNKSELYVEYEYPENIIYSDGEFDKREIVLINREDSSNFITTFIIGNNWAKSTITIFDQIYSELKNKEVDFVINPININTMAETNNEKIIYGNNIGIFEDKKTTNRTSPIEGEIKSVGNGGTVINIDISGDIKSVYENKSTENLVFSIYSENKITKNQFNGKSLYVMNLDEIKEFNIINNSEKLNRGEFTVEVEEKFSNSFLSYSGKKIKLVNDNSVIYVNFDLPVQVNELNGGTLTVSSDENNNYGRVYNIIRNGADEIILKEKIKPFDLYNKDIENRDIIQGQKFIALDSSGKLKLNIVFFKDIENNEVSGFNFKIKSEQSTYFGLNGLSVYQNSRNTLILNNFQSLIGEESLANAVKPNDFFSVSGDMYQPLKSFNNKKTSEDIYHYHYANLIGKYLKGDIDTFISNENLIVEFLVSNSELFSSDIVQKDSSLFLGAEIRFYNNNNIGIEYFSEVIEHSASSIKVKILKKSNWSFEEYSNIYISSGWSWEIDSKNYGFTEGTFYRDIPIKSYKVIEEINSGSDLIKIETTSGLNVNDKVCISSSEKIEINFVKSIVDENFFQLKYPVEKTFFLEIDTYVKVLSDYFSNSHEHIIRNNEVENLNIQEYNEIGLPISHSHRVTALIDNVLDIESSNGTIFAAGSSSKIYRTKNNGENWEEVVDLNFSVEDNITVNGVSEIDVLSDQIIAGTMNGRIFSNKFKEPGIIPLNKPEV